MGQNQEMTADQLARLERMIARRQAEAAARAALPKDREVLLVRERRTGIETSMFGEDGPTVWRQQHGRIAFGEFLVGNERVVAARDVDGNATPLPKYHREKLIDDLQFKGGLLVHAAFRRSAMLTRTTGRYQERTDAPGGWDDVTPNQQDARVEYAAAMNFVHYRFRPVLIHVCCLGFTAQDWALGEGKSPTSAKSIGMQVLKYGLDDLVDFYGLKKTG
jgi:hypothetical protein